MALKLATLETWRKMGKFFKVSQEYKANPKLEAVVTSRIALEASKNPKTVRNLKYYKKVETIPIFGSAVKKEVISKGKLKHGKFVRSTFGNVPDKKLDTLLTKVVNKTLNPNIASIHTSDSLKLVGSGQRYPAAMDNYARSQRSRSNP